MPKFKGGVIDPRDRDRLSISVGHAAERRRAHGSDVLRERSSRRLEFPVPPSARAALQSSSALTSNSMLCFFTSIEIKSPSSTRAIGPPSWASGVTCPIRKPWEPPEKRPSVMSATSAPEARTHENGSWG